MKKSIVLKFLLIAAFVVAGLVSTYAQTRDVAVSSTRYVWNNYAQKFYEISTISDVRIPVVYNGKNVTIFSKETHSLTTTSDNTTTYFEKSEVTTWEAIHSDFGNVTFYMTTYYTGNYNAISIVYNYKGNKEMLTYIVEK